MVRFHYPDADIEYPKHRIRIPTAYDTLLEFLNDLVTHGCRPTEQQRVTTDDTVYSYYRDLLWQYIKHNPDGLPSLKTDQFPFGDSTTIVLDLSMGEQYSRMMRFSRECISYKKKYRGSYIIVELSHQNGVGYPSIDFTVTSQGDYASPAEIDIAVKTLADTFTRIASWHQNAEV